ncbi:MFS transporter [Ramlibacter sp. Leaf400]|uniref:MFS transporter n=1 Tax=Ramlibacter sp. Leaf400 TaxID=1736365 RepID=UPI0006F75012|nr:MFS transporter [Ramlibacter sp. Leaf400]KQT13846.1 MFS transporter [Ramlibacter sp. Leaf400]
MIRPSTGTWTALAVTLAVQALVSMAVLTVPAMAPAMAQSLGVSPTLIGAYVAVVYIGAMLASLLGGPLVMRWGAIRVSQVGLVVCAAGLALLAAAPGLASALVGAWLIGLGYGPITPASSHLLAKSTPPDRRSLVFSIKQAGVPLGGVMAGALVPGLLIVGGTDAALLAVAAGNLLCAVIAQPIRAELDADRQPGHSLGFANLAGPVRLVTSHAELAQLASFSFVFSVVQMCLAAYLVTYLHSALGYSLVVAGAMLSASQVGGVVGRILWGYIADRWLGSRRMLAVLAVLMALCCGATAALQAGTPVALVLVLMAVFGASGTGWNGVYLAEIARLAPPGQASAATGGALSVTFLGVVLGPVLFGTLSGMFDSYRAGYLVLALPTAICAWQLRSARRTKTA